MQFKYFKAVFSNFLSNAHSFFKYNIEKDAIKNNYYENKIESLKNEISLARKEIVEQYFSLNQTEAEKYKDELSYLKSTNAITPFPYPQIKKVPTPECGFDEKVKLPFVIHKNKRLYFPANWTVEGSLNVYCNYIERENLLGGGYTAKAPHQYITDNFFVEEGDIVVDVGCAEALFALDSIEKAKHVFLFEVDKQWAAPLQETFAPYKDKVTIIRKFVGAENSTTSTTLDAILSKYNNDTFFIKMDIEGAEEDVIKSSETFLSSNNKIKLACCTYHRANHAEEISRSLKQLGYSIEFSDGYMLFYLDPHQQPPYFRKGLIRARKFT